MKRRDQKMKMTGWGALVLTHLVLGGGFSQTAFAACKDGGGCSGGGVTVDGVALESVAVCV